MILSNSFFPLAGIGLTILGLLMAVLSVFLILLILVQRGRGGGLTGALGGPGGQSAFGSKAGDTFTKVTIIVAAVWAVTCVIATASTQQSTYVDLSTPASSLNSGPGDSESVSPIGELSIPTDEPRLDEVELTPANPTAEDTTDDATSSPAEVSTDSDLEPTPEKK